MENRAIKGIKAQVILEFALGFIIVLLLAVGGFRIWAGLNDKLVEENTDYQAQRVESGSGNITLSTIGAVPFNLTNVDEPTMNKIQAIQQCDCISDVFKNSAINLYFKQYELKVEIDAYKETIKSLKESLAGLQKSWEAIPWCSRCCLCEVLCRGECAEWSEDGFIKTCVRYHTISVWQVCKGTSSNPCKQCSACSSWNWGWGNNYCFWCPEDDTDGNPHRSCVSMKPNLSDNHSSWRKQIKDNMIEIQKSIDEYQLTLDECKKEKAEYDAQIKDIEPQLACCPGVL